MSINPPLTDLPIEKADIGFYQGFNLLGCGGGTFRQALYFIRYHREAPAGFSAPGSFYRCIEGQEVGALCDRLDKFDDLPDLLGRHGAGTAQAGWGRG